MYCPIYQDDHPKAGTIRKLLLTYGITKNVEIFTSKCPLKVISIAAEMQGVGNNFGRRYYTTEIDIYSLGMAKVIKMSQT